MKSQMSCGCVKLVEFPFSRVPYFASTKDSSAMSQRRNSAGAHPSSSILWRARGGAGGETEGDDCVAWGTLETTHL